MHGFIKNIISIPVKKTILVGITCVFACLLIVTGCNKNLKDYPQITQPLNGVLLVRGYLVSGSDNQYWKLDLYKKTYSKLNNDRDINKLDIQYFLNIRHNLDEQKIIHQYEFNFKSPVLKYVKKYAPDFLKNTPFEEIPFIDKENFQTPSKNANLSVNIDYNKHILFIIDSQKNVLKKIIFKNYIFSPVISPDSKYIAVFEHQPYIFRDGSVYKIRIIDVNTGKVYSFKNDEVSMPGSMLWFQK